jgi:hypothetical protein
LELLRRQIGQQHREACVNLLFKYCKRYQTGAN